MKKCGDYKKHRHCKYDGNIHGKDLTINDFTIPEFLEWLSHKDINEYVICEEIEEENVNDNLQEAEFIIDIPTENTEISNEDDNILLTGTVAIAIEDNQHTLLSGVDVTISNASEEYTVTTTHGVAQFKKIPYGNYNITFSVEGYQFTEDTIEVSNVMNIKIITIYPVEIQGDIDGETMQN